MRFPVKLSAAVLFGASALIPSYSAPAQVAVQFHFGEDDYHRVDGRHAMRGQQYQTMAALAHMLDENAQELNRNAYRSARHRNDSNQARVLASVSDFSRRASDFHNRMDGYLSSPWDMRKEVDDLTRRARSVNGNVVNARLSPASDGLWAAELDILSRMQQVLRGDAVQLPPSAIQHDGRDRWDHRDDNHDGIPDDQQRMPR